MRALSYSVREALVSLRRGGRAGVLSIVTITATLLVLGLFLLATANLDRALARWASAAEMSVFLRDDITPAAQSDLRSTLSATPVVEDIEYVSKREALRRFRRDFVELAAVAESLGDNPLPASFELRLRTGAGAAEAVDRLASAVAHEPGVADIRYDRRWIERLQLAVGLLRGFGLFVVGILALAAAITVANVVRLACHTRRDEIDIMHLVGAPAGFVRGPFIVEGILQGGVGALLALGLVAAVFSAVRVYGARVTGGLIDPQGVEFLSIRLCALLLAGGTVVGCLGAWVASSTAMRKA